MKYVNDRNVSSDDKAFSDGDADGMVPTGKRTMLALIIMFLAVALVTVTIIWIVGSTKSNDGSTIGSNTTATTMSSSADTDSSNPADERINVGLDLDGLAGQKWSNAKKILTHRGASMVDSMILTDDGKSPIVDSNWTVRSISKDKDGSLVIHLRHDVDSDVDTSVDGALDGLLESGSGAWNSVKDGTVGLGQH